VAEADQGFTLTTTPTTRPFWDAAVRRELRLPRCLECGRFHWYPRVACPYCSSQRLEWTVASGDATIETFTVVHRRMHLSGLERRLPFVVAVVRLSEGPTMTTNIVNWAPDTLEIGARVRVTFEDAGLESPLPVFEPVT
jgi:uncharacterized OB-fold protein